MVCNGTPVPQIPQFYAGRSVFITGASGFMGQVLVERLLTTCPDVERLFLLLRRKKESSPDERLRAIKESPIFESIRQHRPLQLDKLSAVAGDITQPRLGLDQDAVDQLRGVSVVFHSAATLKFQEELGAALQQNLKPVMSLLELCDTMPLLQAFVHVSTAYSNADRLTVAERVYPPPAPLHEILAQADKVTPEMTDKFIRPKPNTYTFTKALAEVAVHEHRGHFPAAIFRPTIVVSSLRDPFPGWIQNLNGPSGVIASAGKGLLHVFRAAPHARADLLPVDIAIDTLLAAAWETAVDKSSVVRVYNCSTQENPMTWSQFVRRIRWSFRWYPLDNAYWYPSGFILQNGSMYKLVEFVLHTLPLYLGEYLMTLLGMKNKISLITISGRLQAMNEVLKFFSLREFDFETHNFQKLRQRITPQDAAIFNLEPATIDWQEHHINFVKGVRKYLFKEKDEDLPKAKRHMQVMYIVHSVMLALLFFLLFRFVLQNTPLYDVVCGAGRVLAALFT